tara:strand:+ start:1 stop:786 length:786 start_codon:yes stop_codon:yes gene_type:complete
MVCASDVGLGKKDKNYSRKKLVIIGAGPAGLELALQGAKRDIEVSIFEKQGFIGGNLIGASLIYKPYKKLLNYYQASIKNKLIDLNLSTEISSDDLEKQFLNNQKIVVASGGVPSTSIPNAINIQSWLHPFIVENKGDINSIRSALKEEKYNNFAILGTNTIQLHLAAFLKSIGIDVSLVRTTETVGKSMPVVLRWKILDELKNQVPIISENTYFEKKFDITIDAIFDSNSDFKKLKTIGDSKHGLAYIPQTAIDAVGYFK